MYLYLYILCTAGSNYSTCIDKMYCVICVTCIAIIVTNTTHIHITPCTHPARAVCNAYIRLRKRKGSTFEKHPDNRLRRRWLLPLDRVFVCWVYEEIIIQCGQVQPMLTKPELNQRDGGKAYYVDTIRGIADWWDRENARVDRKFARLCVVDSSNSRMNELLPCAEIRDDLPMRHRGRKRVTVAFSSPGCNRQCRKHVHLTWTRRREIIARGRKTRQYERERVIFGEGMLRAAYIR